MNSMKKNFIFISLLFVLLTGCTNSNDIFTKKQACADLMDEVETKITDKYGENSLVELKKIFYSNKADSCLYSFYISERRGNDNYFTYKLVDALTDETLFEREGCLIEGNCVYSFEEASTYIEEKAQEYE